MTCTFFSFPFFFADFGSYSIAHRYTSMVVLTMDGWMGVFCNISDTFWMLELTWTRKVVNWL